MLRHCRELGLPFARGDAVARRPEAAAGLRVFARVWDETNSHRWLLGAAQRNAPIAWDPRLAYLVLLLDDVVNTLANLQLGSWSPHLPTPMECDPEQTKRRWQAEMDAGGSGTHSTLLGLEATFAELRTSERIGLAMQANNPIL